MESARLSLDQLRPIMREMALADPVAIAPLSGGSTNVFRIDLEDAAAVVLKSFDAGHVAPHKDAYAAGLLADLALPTTRYLLIDESKTRLPFRFALTTYLPGEPAEVFAAHPAYPDLFRQIGALARTLHSVKLPAFGQLPDPTNPDNANHIRGFADYSFTRFVEYGADVRLAARLRTIFDRDVDHIAGASIQPVFAHDDLHPGNILVTETNGQLAISGLIDFGNAQASASVTDLAKTIFICEHSAQDSAPAILEGYGPIDHPSPREALAFYTLLHRVTMWWWLRHIGVLPTVDAPSDIIPALELTAAGA